MVVLKRTSIRANDWEAEDEPLSQQRKNLELEVVRFGLDKSLTSLVVTLRLDALNIVKRNAKITLLIPKFFNKFLYILPG